MIFDVETKYYEVRSDKPNENWTDNRSLQVIPDGSELADKIRNNWPFFDVVIEGEKCVDVIPTERTEPEPSAAQQIEALKAELTAGD